MKQVEGWRHIDESTDELYPWYVKPVLELLDSMDLKDKIVYEFGIGDSSLWWSKRCKRLYGVESDFGWFDKINKMIGSKASLTFHKSSYGYINSIIAYPILFDIVVVDGFYREQCALAALNCIKKGGLLIYDNWMQNSVELQSQKTQDVLLNYEHKILLQEGHSDWATLICFIK